MKRVHPNLIPIVAGIAIALTGATRLFENSLTNALSLTVGMLFATLGLIFLLPSLQKYTYIRDMILAWIAVVWAATELFVARDYTVSTCLAFGASILLKHALKPSPVPGRK